jgi:Rrf2 family protein
MIGVSRQSDYAARIVLHLASLGQGEQATIAEVAEQKKLPLPFVRRIVAQLVNREVLLTARGKKGGIRLGRDASEISLLDIIEAMEGAVLLSECSGEHATCPFRGHCPVQVAWKSVGGELKRSLANVRFDTLASANQRHAAAHRKVAAVAARNRLESPAPRKRNDK